jgi:hypothetical protein
MVIAVLALAIVADGGAPSNGVAATTDDRDAYAFSGRAGPSGALIELPMGGATTARRDINT